MMREELAFAAFVKEVTDHGVEVTYEKMTFHAKDLGCAIEDDASDDDVDIDSFMDNPYLSEDLGFFLESVLRRR